jgi:hypothetical protein
VKGAAAALGAGTTFGGSVLAGLAIGFWVGRQTGASWWVVIGLFAGVMLGGYFALRMLIQAAR